MATDSTDQAVRLLGGKIEYIDGAGRMISLAHPSFPFNGTATIRLDPGKHTFQAIEVPFPTSALKPNRLREVSVKLIYSPIHYYEATVNFPIFHKQ